MLYSQHKTSMPFISKHDPCKIINEGAFVQPLDPDREGQSSENEQHPLLKSMGKARFELPNNLIHPKE